MKTNLLNLNPKLGIVESEPEEFGYVAEQPSNVVWLDDYRCCDTGACDHGQFTDDLVTAIAAGRTPGLAEAEQRTAWLDFAAARRAARDTTAS